MSSYSLKLGTSCTGPRAYSVISDAETLEKASKLTVYAVGGVPLEEQVPAINATLSDGSVVRYTDEMGDLLAGSERCGIDERDVVLSILLVCVLVLAILVGGYAFRAALHRHTQAYNNRRSSAGLSNVAI